MSMTDELAAKAIDALARFDDRRTFEEARAALNEAGMFRARARVDDVLRTIDDAQAALRAAQQMLRTCRQQHDQAVGEAEWALDAKFVTEGNKTFLVVDVEREVEVMHPDREPTYEVQTVAERRPMTADQRAQWKQTEAAKTAPVMAAAAALHEAEDFVAQCRDGVTVAEKAFTAARIDLEAAIATVGVLAASIQKEAR